MIDERWSSAYDALKRFVRIEDHIVNMLNGMEESEREKIHVPDFDARRRIRLYLPTLKIIAEFVTEMQSDDITISSISSR